MIPKYMLEIIDEIDAAMFTGDMFNDRENLDEFEEFLERWKKQLDTNKIAILEEEYEKENPVIYEEKPYVLVNPDGVVLHAGDKEDIESMFDGTHKMFKNYYRKCTVKVRKYDIYLINNKKIGSEDS